MRRVIIDHHPGCSDKTNPKYSRDNSELNRTLWADLALLSALLKECAVSLYGIIKIHDVPSLQMS